MKEEWFNSHLPSAMAGKKGLWVMPHGLKGRGRALPSLEYCHLYCLAGHLTTLSEANTHTQLTSAKFKIITVEVIHIVSP